MENATLVKMAPDLKNTISGGGNFCSQSWEPATRMHFWWSNCLNLSIIIIFRREIIWDHTFHFKNRTTHMLYAGIIGGPGHGGPGTPNFWIWESFFSKYHVKDCGNCLWQFRLLAPHTWQWPCFSKVQEVGYEASMITLKGRCVSSKSYSRIQDRNNFSCWEGREESGRHPSGIIGCPPLV